MLHASGKLSSKMGGPGSAPPAQNCAPHAFGNQTWNVSKGEDRFRRSIYTFINEPLFAGFMTFDGTSEKLPRQTGPQQHPSAGPHPSQ